MWRHLWLRLRRAALKRRELAPAVADFVRTPLVSRRARFQDTQFVSLDIESTGLDASRDAIISIGWVVIADGRVDLASARSLLVRTNVDVGDSATIHGLTDTTVGRGISLDAAIAQVLIALKGRVLVVHYAALDVGLIDRACLDLYGTRVPLPVIDTLALEWRRLRRQNGTEHRDRLRLSHVRDVYNLPRYAAHTSLGDAIATAELLLAMVARRGNPDTMRLGDVL